MQAEAAAEPRVSTGTPALHRLEKVRVCCMPYWSSWPHCASQAPTIACNGHP